MFFDSITNTAFSVGAFATLNNSDTLNSAANRISSGSINRETLAQTVARNSIYLGLSAQFSKMKLGDRPADLAQLASKIIFENTADEMHDSIRRLVRELIHSYAQSQFNPGLEGAIKNLALQVLAEEIAGLAEVTANFAGEPNFIEKLIATHIHLYTKAPLQKALSDLPIIGTAFTANLVTDIFQRAMVDKPEFNQSDRPVFQFLAAITNEFLTNKKNYQKPLADYCAELSTSDTRSDFEKTLLAISNDLLTDKKNYKKLLQEYFNKISISAEGNELKRTVLISMNQFITDKDDYAKPLIEYFQKTLDAARKKAIEYIIREANKIAKELTPELKEMGSKLGKEIGAEIIQSFTDDVFNFIDFQYENIMGILLAPLINLIIADPLQEEDKENSESEQEVSSLGEQLRAIFWPDPDLEADGLAYMFGDSAM